jgi:mannose-6-phosphate isomerase-like protein (cupin superfamily)
VHRRHVESFYILEGELTVTAGGRELRAVEGTWVQVPAGLPHAVRVTGGQAGRFLDVHTPSYGVGALDQEPA